MAEWLYENGIGEERAILVEDGAIVAARVEWGEALRAGLVAEARLMSKAAGSRRGTAQFAGGEEALVEGLPPNASEGAPLTLRVTRTAIAERGRHKLAQARPAPNEAPRAAPTLLEELRAGAMPLRVVRPNDGAFDAHGWDDLIEQAKTSLVPFPGGSLTISPAPAMTLIDVDGILPARALALAAVPVIAASLPRLDIGGSVGIDFPTLAEKRDRRAVDSALAEALSDWRGERTAMNGFGFVQLVSRLERPPLLSLVQRRPAASAARMLLRRAERVPPGGSLLLTAHPAVRSVMRDEWLAELARRTGREVVWHEDSGLAESAGFAQSVMR